MTKSQVLGATALSLSLIIAAPVLAQQAPGGHPGAARVGGNMGSARAGAGMNANSNFRGGQANFARSNGQAQFAQRGGEFRGDRGRGYGRDIGAGVVAAGVATGAAIAYGSSGYYNDGYYGPSGYADSYAYDDSSSDDTGVPVVTYGQQAPVVVEETMGGDASYCAQRYRSYDPASGTYLGFDGMRHPCQ